jgi:CheY-like chemotaxis protein
MRILLVEDDVDSREALAIMLQGHGAVTESAATCADGWARFDARPPDLLISDIGLPDGDGYQLMRRVRERPADRGGAVPAIALTAFGGAEDAKQALRSGYQAHVVKPFQFAELLRVIESLVHWSAARG